MLRKLALGTLTFSTYLFTSNPDPECCGIIGMVSKKPLTSSEV